MHQVERNKLIHISHQYVEKSLLNLVDNIKFGGQFKSTISGQLAAGRIGELDIKANSAQISWSWG